jgi:hypothetical protein
MRNAFVVCLLCMMGAVAAADGPLQRLESELIHLRSGELREWSSFPDTAPQHWEKRLALPANERPLTLQLRQQDVKQAWQVLLNGQPLGELLRDERDALQQFAIQPGALTGKGDVLRIEPKGKHASPDDIRVGQIELLDRDIDAGHWRVAEVEVVDADSGEPLACCLTIVDKNGTLVPLGMKSHEQLAVRTGVAYTSTGRATLKLPDEPLPLYATRGFEYSLAQASITGGSSEKPMQYRLALRREVPVPGYIACDTHIHTFTFSRHGDATIDERMITLAGEGIELPIATDHNVLIDYEAHAQRMNVRQFFTPVIGDEVTTKLGHFNVFPVAAGARLPKADLDDWQAIFDDIYATPGVKVCILNHARDLHSGIRPFDPTLFNAAVAEQLSGWPLRFNAMEVINSGATQSDSLQLMHDWMSLLNGGYQVTPVGSSDSHDVSRFIVGQGRTYIRCDDRDPAKIDVATAVENFLAGRVLVSYGLLAELKVDGQFTSGDLATSLGEEIKAEITVSAPQWINPSKVQLYANGKLVREEAIPLAEVQQRGGIKWRGTWKLPRPSHDQHLVAVAIGPGIDEPYWATARPYQPMSPDLDMHTLGCSGAVWTDADGDRRQSSARDYAQRLWTDSEKQVDRLVKNLATYDAAVAAHAAHLYHASGGDLDSAELKTALAASTPNVREGFRDYYAAWRESQLARAEK